MNQPAKDTQSDLKKQTEHTGDPAEGQDPRTKSKSGPDKDAPGGTADGSHSRHDEKNAAEASLSSDLMM